MTEIIKTNLPGILTLVLGILIQIVGYKMGKLKDEADRKKISVDAADGFRDDLMKQLEDAHKRIDSKDATIDQLKIEIIELKAVNRELKWEITIKTYEIERANSRIAELEATVKEIKEQMAMKNYG